MSEFEVAFDAETRKALLQDINRSISEIETYRSQARKEIAKIVRDSGIESQFSSAVSRLFEMHFRDKYGYNNKSEGGDVKIGARATLHVADIVFQSRLFQLINYYPEGGGAGRDFSFRMGIIGRVWRSGSAACAGYLTRQVAPMASVPDEDDVATIRLEWGLSTAEALKFRHRPSFCCVPMISENRTLGVLYIDSSKENFGWTTNIEKKLERLKNDCQTYAETHGVIKSLVEIERQISKKAPRVDQEW